MHIIFEDSRLELLPKLQSLTKIEYMQHKKLGWSVAINVNSVTKMIGSVLGSIMKNRFRFVSSFDEAFVFLVGVGDALPNINTLKEKVQELTDT